MRSYKVAERSGVNALCNEEAQWLLTYHENLDGDLWGRPYGKLVSVYQFLGTIDALELREQSLFRCNIDPCFGKTP